MFQQLIFVGRVGRPPEMRYTPSGQPVTSFSVATNRQYTDNSGQAVKETIWFQVSTFGKQAEICNQYVTKGMLVLVEGRLTADKSTGGPRTFTRQDGTTGASFEVSASTVRFLSSSQDTGGQASQRASEPVDEDEVPF